MKPAAKHVCHTGLSHDADVAGQAAFRASFPAFPGLAGTGGALSPVWPAAVRPVPRRAVHARARRGRPAPVVWASARRASEHEPPGDVFLPARAGNRQSDGAAAERLGTVGLPQCPGGADRLSAWHIPRRRHRRGRTGCDRDPVLALEPRTARRVVIPLRGRHRALAQAIHGQNVSRPDTERQAGGFRNPRPTPSERAARAACGRRLIEPLPARGLGGFSACPCSRVPAWTSWKAQWKPAGKGIG